MSEEAVAALRAGAAVVLPTDTVYGLCVDAYREGPARRLRRLKGRPAEMPVALLAAELDVIIEALPELRGRAADTARALLPGPYTLVFPNPARRFPWLCGTNPDAVGVRVPELGPEARAVLDPFGAVAATSANEHGGADPATVDEIPAAIRAGARAIVDGGRLPGTPSTVLDLTGPRPRVLREGAVSARDALAVIARATR